MVWEMFDEFFIDLNYKSIIMHLFFSEYTIVTEIKIPISDIWQLVLKRSIVVLSFSAALVKSTYSQYFLYIFALS